jgi:fumarate reductase subunit D
MRTNAMTADEFADSCADHARWSSIVMLSVCSALSLLGGWYNATVYGAGTVASAVTTDTVTVVLILSVHLRGAVRAAYETNRVSKRTYVSSSAGMLTLIAMTLAANYATLHALAEHMQLHWLTAILAPAATDVGVLVSTDALFSLKPKLLRVYRKPPASAAPSTPASASESPASAAPSTPPNALASTSPPSASTAASTPPGTSAGAAVLPASAAASTSAGASNPLPSASPSASADTSADTSAQLTAAQQVVRRAGLRTPVHQVAQVLQLHRDGESGRSISDALGLNQRTVQRIVKAADASLAGAPRDRRLTTVG